MTETEKLVKANIERHKDRDEDNFDEEALKEAQDNIEFVKQFKDKISEDLFGQDQAINIVANSMKTSMKDEKGPKSTYLFLGSPATGKTYLAIETMLSFDTGMIGFPLRLLAREVYDKIIEKLT